MIDILVSRGRAKLADVTESDLVNARGEVGPVARRQRIQREYTLRNEEYTSPDLGPLLEAMPYPLHFIDFETSRIAVPYHAGMHPYELVAFQWSCHSISEKGAPMTHSDWINVNDSYPNFDFAASLMQSIGTTGTVFTWSHHENSTLKDIYNQMERYACADPALAEWLRGIVKFNPGENTRITDLCEIAKAHYFHPEMGGRLSIKYVLPAIWKSDVSLHAHPEFREYYGKNESGEVLNPYETLKPLPFGNLDNEGIDEVIQEGGGAMRAYQEMLYGLSRNDRQVREQWKKLLRQYCKLDTAAMVMIWLHWLGKNP